MKIKNYIVLNGRDYAVNFLYTLHNEKKIFLLPDRIRIQCLVEAEKLE